MLIHVSNGHNTDLLRTLFSKLIYLMLLNMYIKIGNSKAICNFSATQIKSLFVILKQET